MSVSATSALSAAMSSLPVREAFAAVAAVVAVAMVGGKMVQKQVTRAKGREGVAARTLEVRRKMKMVGGK